MNAPTEPTPLERLTEAQDFLTAFTIPYRRALTILALALLVAGVAAMNVLPFGRVLSLVSIAALLVALVLLVRARRSLREAQLRVNQVFLHYRSKSPETCGSMDPHFTRARN